MCRLGPNVCSMDGFNVPSFYTHVQEDLLTFLMSICIKVLAYDCAKAATTSFIFLVARSTAHTHFDQ
jgi:hypothetical protein